MSRERGRIRALDPTLANQIAAGEVVERPASVLKELLENSLDAGARRISVEASRGGTGLLRVSDDGTGIHVADLALALQRHATSKIATLDELESVTSMGFRGEALPSIASVSRLRLDSRGEGVDAAWSVQAEGGPAGEPTPVAHPQGTTVTVRDLFFNTPVRRRFLRTPRTELRHLDRVFRRIALTAFEVTMVFTHDGRELLRVAGAADAAGRRRRVRRLMGPAFADAAVTVDEAAGGMRLWGWLGAADGARERSDLQHLYVNGRGVSDTTVRHAVRLAYGDRVPDRAHPAWLLYLEIDPRAVDVNVHPSKQEVRFREARMVHDFVRARVAAALEAGGDARPAGPAAPRATMASAGVATARVRDRIEERPLHAAGRPADPSAPRLLALLDGGLVVAARGSEALLVPGPALRRAHVRRQLEQVLAGEQRAVSRPLLIPERIAMPRPSLHACLEPLGFELRDAGEHGVLLLAVPDALARVPGRALADALAEVLASALGRGLTAGCRRPDDILDTVLAVVERVPLSDADEAASLLEALHRGGGDIPGLALDAAGAARLTGRDD